MSRRGAMAALIGGTVTLAGCVWDPYTQQYVPCCNYYGYPYRYPPSYYYRPAGPPPPPAGAPAQPPPGGNAPPPAQPPPSYGPPASYPPPGAYPRQGAAPGGALARRFDAANTTHDGRLTFQQAQTGMPAVARSFAAIDTEQKGYVTLPEIRQFLVQQRHAGQLG